MNPQTRHPRRIPRSSTGTCWRPALARLAATLCLGLPGIHAAVLYHDPADVTLRRGDWVMVNILAGTFDLDGSGAPGEFQVAYTGSETTEVNLLVGSYVGSLGLYDSGNRSLARFNETAVIGAAGGADGWSTETFAYVELSGASGFEWNTGADGTTGRIGLRLTTDGTTSGVYYGWLGIRYDDASNSLTLLDMAFETTPGLGINAVAAPEPGTWAAGLFLAGSGGALWFRRRRR